MQKNHTINITIVNIDFKMSGHLVLFYSGSCKRFIVTLNGILC